MPRRTKNKTTARQLTKQAGFKKTGSKQAGFRRASVKKGVPSVSGGAKSGPEACYQTGERLQKVLAAAGVASRREAEQLILEGRVEVDGDTVIQLGTRVNRARQSICVDGQALAKPKLVHFAVHKPEGVVCTAKDPAGRTRVTDLLPPDVGRVFNVGRLDIASEGLILVTNDGELANQLTHPRHGVEKTYEVQVAGHMDTDALAVLRKGVHLAEGFVRVVHVRIKSRRKNSTILEMVLDEGRNREVRRLLAKVGHRVQRLTRIAVGPIRLGNMPRGVSRRLTPEEVRKLRAYIAEAERTRRYQKGASAQPASRQGTLGFRRRKRKAAAGKAGAGKAGVGRAGVGKAAVGNGASDRVATRKVVGGKRRPATGKKSSKGVKAKRGGR